MISERSPLLELLDRKDAWSAAMKNLFRTHWVVVAFLAGMGLMLRLDS